MYLERFRDSFALWRFVLRNHIKNRLTSLAHRDHRSTHIHENREAELVVIPMKVEELLAAADCLQLDLPQK